MANKETVAITKEQFDEIIDTMRSGSLFFRSNDRIATMLALEGNLGLRIGDLLHMRFDDIIKDGKRYRFRSTMVEEKTEKERVFTVPDEIRNYIKDYCDRNDIPYDVKMFNPKDRNPKNQERTIQRYLCKVCKYLGYENRDAIGTHSFRKYYATSIFEETHDIRLVQRLLQHSSVETTMRYTGITDERLEDAIRNHVNLR